MNTTQRVESILKASRKARNSDFELWLIFAQKCGVSLSQHQIERLREMPSFETIRRTRQKYQMDGKYRADKEVEDARFDKFVTQKHNRGLPKGYYFPEEEDY